MAEFRGAVVYMLKEREHIRCRDRVVKIGFSDGFKARMQAYPNDSCVLAAYMVTDGRRPQGRLCAPVQAPHRHGPRVL
jgi:hypothetical protein